MKTWFRTVCIVRDICLGAVFLVISAHSIALADLSGTAASLEPPVKEIIIDVKTRQFRPDMISLQLGEKARFILRNKDAELHAFVPVGLFLDTTHNVSGNGAPQFGKGGLVRVLLPSTGQTEILFTPEKAGNYPFFCDLPGHVMRGTIVVQE